MGKIKKPNILIIVLAILLIIALVYIFTNIYQERKAQEELTIFQEGAQYGYQQAIIQILQQASTCQQVPVYANNQSLNMIAVECLTG